MNNKMSTQEGCLSCSATASRRRRLQFVEHLNERDAGMEEERERVREQKKRSEKMGRRRGDDTDQRGGGELRLVIIHRPGCCYAPLFILPVIKSCGSVAVQRLHQLFSSRLFGAATTLGACRELHHGVRPLVSDVQHSIGGASLLEMSS